MPDMKKVASSNVDQIGYDKASETAYVKFLSGGMYKVHPVDHTTFQAFEATKSKGQFFNSTFKANPEKYTIEKA